MKWLTGNLAPLDLTVSIGNTTEVRANGPLGSTIQKIMHTGTQCRAPVLFFWNRRFETFVVLLERCVERSGEVSGYGGEWV